MNNRGKILTVGGFFLLLLLGFFVAFPPIQFVDPGQYDNTPVTVVDDNGTVLATVDARIADTREKRRVGLRRTDNLSDGEGMLFIHDEDGEKPYIMPPEMSFPLDIIFIAPNGTIRTIQHASVPDGDTTLDYPGRGRYVLEVPRGYANRTGIDPGDRVVVPENLTRESS